jgi:hypothetical protein
MHVACWACGAEASARERIGRRDTCARCGADLHSCRQCSFHDARAYNACREPQAERVLDKERANFCDYFAPVDATPATAGGGMSGAVRGGDTRAELERLFRRR